MNLQERIHAVGITLGIAFGSFVVRMILLGRSFHSRSPPSEFKSRIGQRCVLA